jgi:hypothetical protein
MVSPYDKLFERYVTELAAARQEATAWWDALLAAAGPRAQDVRLRWPCGSVSHPRVIAVYRKYYLECERLNQKNAEPAPEEAPLWGEDEPDKGPKYMPTANFLLDNLEPVDPDLARFMEMLILSPIGLNPDGDFA